MKAFAQRIEAKSGIYAYEQRKTAAFDAEARKIFRAHAKAWAFFQAQPASYRKTMTWWVVSAKRVETQRKRLERLILDCAAGRRML